MGALLEQVTSKPQIRPPRIVVHGKGGVGKTSFAADAPDVLFLPLEDGLGKLDIPHLPQPERFEDVLNAITELANEEHGYRSLAIDTIDHLEPLVWESVCDDGGKDHIEDFGYNKGYFKADPKWADFFHRLDALRRKGMTVIVLSHCDIRNVDNPLVGSYSKVEPKLHKRANALMHEWADVVGFLDTKQVRVEKGKDGGRKTQAAQATGERVLYLEDRGAFAAKNRYDLPTEMPVPKDNPYQPLRSAIATALKPAKEAA